MRSLSSKIKNANKEYGFLEDPLYPLAMLKLNTQFNPEIKKDSPFGLKKLIDETLKEAGFSKEELDTYMAKYKQDLLLSYNLVFKQ